MQPVSWGPGKQAQFLEWFDDELRRALSHRQPLEQQWRDWLDQYRAQAKQPIRHFPYEGASNVELPITATDVDQLYAKFLQTLHASDDLWSIEPLNERWVQAAKPMQDFLTWLDRNFLKMYNVNKRVLLEMVKLGTGIYKHGWVSERRPTWGYGNDGRPTKLLRLRQQPFVDHVRLFDLVLPPYSYAIQPDDQGGAPWVAERLRISREAFIALGNTTDERMPPIAKADIDAILAFEERSQTEHEDTIRRQDYEHTAANTKVANFDDTGVTTATQGSGAVLVHEIELWEVHARVPTRSDTYDDIVCWYHLPSRKLLRAWYPQALHGQRPYEVVRYFPGEGFYGIGVCEQKEVFQRGESDLFNFQMDNVLLANSRMIVARGGANISAGEPVYPWKIWITEGAPKDDFSVFPMADIYQSLPQTFSQFAVLGERRTGISDIQLGSIDQLPGRTPATTMTALLQEGNRRPDLTVKDMRYEGLSRVGLRVLQHIQERLGRATDQDGQQFLQLVTSVLGMPEGQAVAEKLLMPLENVEYGLGVAITATSGSANKEVQKQSLLALMQIAGQVAPQLIQLLSVAQQAQGTPVGEVAVSSAQGLIQLYTRLLEQYDIRNVDQVAPQIQASQAQPGLGGLPPASLGALAGSGPGAGGLASLGGMAGV